jgi:hypothetical protein
MKSNKSAVRYATALLELAIEHNKVELIEADILQLLKTAEEVLDSVQLNGPIWIYTREGGREQLDAAGIPYEIVAQFKHYQPALLSMPFLNPNTRESRLIPVEIVKVAATK